MSIHFKVDENLPVEITSLLRELGFDAASVYEQGLGGHPDPGILAVCKEENRVLLTLDLDFADIRRYPPKHLPGLIVLRLQKQDKSHVIDVCRRLAKALSIESPIGRLWVVDERRIKVRE